MLRWPDRGFGLSMERLLLVLALSFGAHHTTASLSFDPFADATADGGTSYAVGGFLFKQSNSFGTTWYALTNTPAPPATGFPVVASDSLSYPGLPASAGNCISIPATTGVMGRLTVGFTVTTGTAYFSFLLKVTDLSGVDTTGTQNNFFAGFGDTIGNQNATLLRAATRIYTREAGGGTSATLVGFTNDPSQWVAGKFNRALQFDGVSNEVVIDGFKGIVGTNARTVSAWIKTTETNNSIGIVSWGDLPSGNKWSLLVQNTTDPKGTLRLELGYGNTIAGTPVNDGQWHHVAWVLDDLPSPTSTNVQFYVDGQSDIVVGGPFVDINTVALNDVLLGCDIQERFFNGTIEEVRIYDRALNGTEIAAQYTATSDSAVAWHRRYFGNEPINWNADDEGDGVTRLGEYAFGGQPWIADSQFAQLVPEIIAGHLHIHFHRRLAGSQELVYQLKRSIDLSNWTILAGTEISATMPGFEDVVFRSDAAIPDQSPVFVRLSSELP